ncbi:unnamed protein product, partial [Ectocarpus sp. 8 AP-2014]
MGYGDGGVRNWGSREAGKERRLLRRCAESSNTVLKTGSHRLQSGGGLPRHRLLHASAEEGGGGSGGQVVVEPRTAAAFQAPTGGGELPAPAPAESEWESILRERLERKLRKPGRRKRARTAATARASPNPTFSSPRTQWQQQQQQQQQDAESHFPANDDNQKNVSGVDRTDVSAAVAPPFSRATTSEAGAGTEPETWTDGIAETVMKEGLRG